MKSRILILAIALLTNGSGAFASPISFENCVILEKPLAYQNPSNGKYMLAVNTCMQQFFESFGFISNSTTPSNSQFSNIVQLSSGAPNNAYFYSPQSKLLFSTPSENNIYESIVDGLGFVKGRPSDIADYSEVKVDLIPNIHICCERASHTLKSCAQVSWRNGDNDDLDSCKTN